VQRESFVRILAALVLCTAIDLRLARIETKQDEVSRYYATRADVTDAKNSIIMWVVSAILLAQLLPALLKKFGL